MVFLPSEGMPMEHAVNSLLFTKVQSTGNVTIKTQKRNGALSLKCSRSRRNGGFALHFRSEKK